MPSFYPRPMANGMPLTPPDSGTGYGYSNLSYCSDPYAHQALNQVSRHDTAYDYQQTYMQPAVAPAPPAYPYPSQNGYQSGNSLPPIHSYYEPIGAPILPPLRIQDRVSFTDDYQRCLQQQEQNTAAAREQQQQQRNTTKEEKPTGGVSAKLDYDMERMTDFVVTAVQSIFQHNMHSPPSFRKWVHQVLSATRLPSATILLSLHFLNDRVSNRPSSVQSGENQIYRLLAVSLILGSKFLDDNTFINRSWSDVTAIKVTELNMLEMQWLQLLDYRLHIDPDATNGLRAWLDSWKEYDAKCAARQQSARLSPIEHQHHTYRRERFAPYPSPYSGTPARLTETSQSSRSSTFSTPYTSADPWAATGYDFLKRQNRYPPQLLEIDEANRRMSEERSRQSSYAYPHDSQSSYYPSSTYGSPWNQHAWSGMHRFDCSCSACAYQHHYRPYSMASSYASQPVMG